MADEEGNTPQDRRTAALSEDHVRRHFIEQFVKDNPGISPQAVEDALENAAARIAPSEDQDPLTKAVREVIGSTDR